MSVSLENAPNTVAALDKPSAHGTLSLRANFSWMFLGNTCHAGCQWGVLMVLAKNGNPEMVGQFALGLAVTAPVFMLANLQLRGIQATDARDEYRFGDFLGLRLLTTVLALLIVVSVAHLTGYRKELAAIVIAVGVGKALDSLGEVFYGLIQKHEQMDRIAKAKMITGFLSLGGMAAGIALTGNLLWGAVGWAIAPLLTLVCYIFRAASDVIRMSLVTRLSTFDALRPRWNLNVLARLTWLALPLGCVMMLSSLSTNIPRYFVERYLGEGNLGIFAAMGYTMVAGTMVVLSLAHSASPRLARYFAAGDRAAFIALLSKLLGIGVLLGAVALLVVVVAGRPILATLYTPEYAQYMDVFILLTLAAALGFVSSFLGTALTPTRRFKTQFLINLIAISTLLCLCALFVPTYGLVGAATAGVVVAAIRLVAYSTLIYWVLPPKRISGNSP